MTGHLDNRTIEDIRLRRYSVKERRMVEIIGGKDADALLIDCGLRQNDELMVEVKDE